MIVCNDSSVFTELKDKINISTHQLKEITQQIELDLSSLHQYTINEENRLRLQNPYIVKSVIKYMANGLNKTDAMLLTAQDFETNVNRVEAVYWAQGRYMSAINLYAKRYTCEKLKNNGFTAKQIAKILGVSENHIFKLLKANVNFWFLEDRRNR